MGKVKPDDTSFGFAPEHPTFSESWNKLSFHVNKLWNDFILQPLTDAIKGIILFISQIIEQFMVNWVEYDEQKPKPSKERTKYVSAEAIARILYLRTGFGKEECKTLAPYILTIDAVDKLEFAICAYGLGFSAEKILWAIKYKQYSESITYWREVHPPKFWDCTLTSSDFENPRDLFGDNVLVREDGEILVVEDAPPVEILSKRKNG
jgi:hypothetical protein